MALNLRAPRWAMAWCPRGGLSSGLAAWLCVTLLLMTFRVQSPAANAAHRTPVAFALTGSAVDGQQQQQVSGHTRGGRGLQTAARTDDELLGRPPVATAKPSNSGAAVAAAAGAILLGSSLLALRNDRGTVFSAAVKLPSKWKKQSMGSRPTLVACRAEESEEDKIYREAYETQKSRAELLQVQLETAMAKKMGMEGMKVSISSEQVAAPGGTFGRSWKQAYEEAKNQADAMEAQLNKTSEPEPVAPPPPPPPPAPNTMGGQYGVGGQPMTPQIMGEMMEERARREAEFIADLFKEDARMGNFIVGMTVRVLQKLQENKDVGQLDVNIVKDGLGNDIFDVKETYITGLGSILVLTGNVVPGKEAGQVLDEVTQRVLKMPGGPKIETYISQMSETQQALVLMPKQIAYKNYYEWWQWVLVILSFIFSALLAGASSLVVLGNSAATDVEGLNAEVEATLIPVAGIFLGILIATEGARRAAAAASEVELLPPAFIPGTPASSSGVVGVINRNVQPYPNKEAEVLASLVPAATGLGLSLLVILVGLLTGVDPSLAKNLQVSLNFQGLPLLLRSILPGVVGTTPIKEVVDIFQDPIIVGLPTNPLVCGGVLGLIVTSFNTFPIGLLDGMKIIKNIDKSIARFAGAFAFGVLFIGTIARPESSFLYSNFVFFAIFLQGGIFTEPESPPRDTVTEVSDSLKLAGFAVVALAIAICFPATFFS